MPFTVKANTLVQIPGYPLRSQTVAYTGTAAASSAFGNRTQMIRVRATTDCFISIGTAVTATSSSHFLAANETQDFAVNEGDVVSAIQSAVSGSLYVSEFEIRNY